MTEPTHADRERKRATTGMPMLCDWCGCSLAGRTYAVRHVRGRHYCDERFQCQTCRGSGAQRREPGAIMRATCSDCSGLGLRPGAACVSCGGRGATRSSVQEAELRKRQDACWAKRTAWESFPGLTPWRRQEPHLPCESPAVCDPPELKCRTCPYQVGEP